MVTISAGIWNCCVINPFNAPHRNPQTIAAKIPGIHPNSESTLMNVIQTTFVKETIDPKEISIPPIKRQIVCPKATIINGNAASINRLTFLSDRNVEFIAIARILNAKRNNPAKITLA